MRPRRCIIWPAHSTRKGVVVNKLVLVLLCILCPGLAFPDPPAGNCNSTLIEMSAPPVSKLDPADVARVWGRIKKELNAPADLPMPPIVLDWEVPVYAKMGFQYPNPIFPNTRMQISIAPRTLDIGREMLLFGIGHELTHYAFLMRDNEWNPAKKVFEKESLHHCNAEFMGINRKVSDEIWSMYHSDVQRSAMEGEISRSCSRHPGQ